MSTSRLATSGLETLGSAKIINVDEAVECPCNKIIPKRRGLSSRYHCRGEINTVVGEGIKRTTNANGSSDISLQQTTTFPA